MIRHLLLLLFSITTFSLHAQLPADSTSREMALQRQKMDEQHFLLSGGIGPGFWLFLIPENANKLAKDYYNELRTGLFYQFDAGYYFKGDFGIGMQHSRFNTDNKIDNVTLVDNNGTVIGTGEVSDKISMTYYSAQILYRIWNKNRNGFININGGLGWLYYKDEAVVIYPLKIRGDTYVLDAGLGYYIKLGRHIWAGGYGVYKSGVLLSYITDDGTRLITTNLKDEEAVSVTHLSIGIKAAISF